MITFGFAYASNPKVPGFRTYGTVATEKEAQSALLKQINKEGITFEQSKDGKTRALVNGEKTGYMYFATDIYVAVDAEGRFVSKGAEAQVLKDAEKYIKKIYGKSNTDFVVKTRNYGKGKRYAVSACFKGDPATSFVPDAYVHRI